MTLKYTVYNEDIKRPYLKILIIYDLINPPFYRNRGSIPLYYLCVHDHNNDPGWGGGTDTKNRRNTCDMYVCTYINNIMLIIFNTLYIISVSIQLS